MLDDGSMPGGMLGDIPDSMIDGMPDGMPVPMLDGMLDQQRARNKGAVRPLRSVNSVSFVRLDAQN